MPGLTLKAQLKSGVVDEEKADAVWNAGEGSRAEAGADPEGLPAEVVPPYATAGGVLEGLMASCLGHAFLCCRGAVVRQENSLGFHWLRLHRILWLTGESGNHFSQIFLC